MPHPRNSNKADKLESALAAIRSVLDHTSTQRTIDDVSTQFYEELDAVVRARNEFVGWEGTRYAIICFSVRERLNCAIGSIFGTDS